MSSSVIDVFKYFEYRAVIRAEYEARRSRRAMYSIRAFARDLSYNASSLSEVLNGKKGISLATAEKFANRFKFQDIQFKYFIDLVMAEEGLTATDRQASRSRLRSAQSSSARQPPIEWHCFRHNEQCLTIYELIRTNASVHDLEQLSRATGFSVDDTRACLESLASSGLIVREPSGHFSKTDRRITYAGFRRDNAMGGVDEASDITANAASALNICLTCDSNQIGEALSSIASYAERFEKTFRSENPENGVFNLEIKFKKASNPLT